MAYIGVTPSNVFGQGSKDLFDGDGSTTAFTLSRAVLLATDVEVFVGNVRQEPNVAYTVSGTTLTFTGTPASGTGNIYAVHQTANQGTLVPPTGRAENLSTLVTSGTITSGGTVAVTGNVTATGTVEPAGDTAAGDNAAIGFTAAEGLILTGQGSTNDVTIKNDADADVIEIPTGTTNVNLAGNTTVGGTLAVTGNTTVGGTLGATGASTLTGALSAKGGVVFNEDSADVDFRVESNDSANALVVNGGTNRVGIGTDSPDHAIHVVASTDGTGVSGDDSFVAHFQNLEATADKSFGVKISAGSTGTDQALTIVDHDGTNSLYSMTGAGTSSQVANKASVYAMNVYHAGDNSNRYGIAIRTGSNDGGGTNYSIGFQRGAGNAVGSITHSGGSTSFNTSSDYRLKENVDYTFDATTRLKQLKPARFNFIGFSNTVDGFLAHEVSSVIPEAVVGAKDAVDADDNIEPQAIDQSKLVPLLVKTIQELEARITALEKA